MEKQPLHRKGKQFAVFIIVLEIILSTAIAYYFALGDIKGGWDAISSWPYVIIALVICIVGIVKGIFYLRKMKSHALSWALVLVSIITFPLPGLASRLIVPLITPAVQSSYRIERQKEWAAYDAKQEDTSEAITAIFRNPQKVVAIDEEYNLMLLENGMVLRLLGIDNLDKEKEFAAWAKNTIVGNTVELSLKGNNDGLRPGQIMTCDAGYENIVKLVRKRNGMSETEGGYCSVISVYMNWQGKSVNEQFLRR
ncbi:MAG TPA: hypothetical protein PK950_01975 [Candidatus Paceibacterota bacterium]|nr:hypothetical protein [Candidatus Paceibacterota bacterium]